MLLAIMFLMFSWVYLFMGIHTILTNPHDRKNQLFFLLSILFVAWTSFLAFYNLTQVVDVAVQIRRFSVLTWGVIHSVILHLVLRLRHFEHKIKSVPGFLLLTLIYIPAVINLVLYIGEYYVAEELVLTKLGWVLDKELSDRHFIWDNYFYAYYLLNTCISLALIWDWYEVTKIKREKKQANRIFWSYLAAFLLGTIIEVVLPMAGLKMIYGITSMITAITFWGMWIAINKYGLMNYNPSKMALEMLDLMNEGLVILDPYHQVVQMNKQARQLLSYDVGEVLPSSYEMGISKNYLIGGGPGTEAVLITKQGKNLPVIINVTSLYDSVNEPAGYMIMFQDISLIKDAQRTLENAKDTLEHQVMDRTRALTLANEQLQNEIEVRKKAEEEIRRLAYFDYLTNLPNHRMLLAELDRLIESKAEGSFSVMFLDLDAFKNVNDTMGHSKGDLLLIKVADRFKKDLVGNHLVSRIGGDEFIILLDHIKSPKEVEVAMHNILNLFKKPFDVEHYSLNISASIGAAIYPDHGMSSDELIKAADIAMYHAKSKGRLKGIIYTEALKVGLDDEMTLTNELYTAIHHKEFLLYYQPQYNGVTGDLLGVEALVRWQHPERGLISPGIFIPLAEKTGLINDLGVWVLEEAMRQQKEWERVYNRLIPMAINISVKQMGNRLLLETIDLLAKGLKVDLGNIEFEVTESIFMKEHEGAIDCIQEIKKLGAKVSIDDFGVRYSVLSSIKNMSVHKIKIDKEFVDGIGIDPKDEAIIKTIIDMADNLGFVVLAEGVEERHQLNFLVDQGCSNIQGYYFSRPLPPGQLIDMILSHAGGHPKAIGIKR